MQKAYCITAALLILLIGQAAYAAQYDLKGKVTDNEGAGIGAATVNLLNVTDSSWVTSQLTAEDGAFIIKEVAEKEYLVNVSALGYAQSYTRVTVNNSADLKIILQKQSTGLKEVTVTAKVPYMETGAGKTVLNVGSTIMATGTNILELLKKSPGVTVSATGNIGMTGKNGVLVLVDDRPLYLSAEQLSEYLKSLSADQVAQLELITQPSAKYDAEGNAGIINIKMKKNKTRGFNGTADAEYCQSPYPSYNGNVQLYYNKNKLNLSLVAGHMLGVGFMHQLIDRNEIDPATGKVLNNFYQTADAKEIFSNTSLKVGADYAINEKIKAGVSILGIYHPNNESLDGSAKLTDQVNSTVTYNTANNKMQLLKKNANFNGYVRYSISKESELSFNTDYLSYYKKTYQQSVNQNYDDKMSSLPGLSLDGSLPSAITVFSNKVDYSGTLKSVKIEAGVKSSFVHTDKDAAYSVWNNGAWEPDNIRSSHFIYNENINAVYVNGNKSFGKKWQAQAGLRAENANTDGRQVNGGKSFARSDVALFPTAFVSYKLNDRHQFEANYGRRVHRPDYQLLDPFREYISQYNYRIGNPYLLPEYSQNIELKHVYKDWLVTTLSYSHTDGLINHVLITGDTDRTIYAIPKNIASNNIVSLNINYNKQLAPWFRLTTGAEGYYAQHKGQVDNFLANVSGTGYQLNLNGQFSFLKKYNAEILVFYSGRNIESIMDTDQPAVYFSAGVSKKVFKDSVIKLDVRDPFYAYRYQTTAKFYNLDSQANIRYRTQEVALSFTWNFGRKTEMEHYDIYSDEAKRVK